MTDLVPVRRALISLSDKSGLEELVAGLQRHGVAIVSIGGPSMVRSAAKNHAYVAIVTDPADYSALIVELDANGGTTSLELRRKLAAKAFALTAEYDSMISQWFAFADQGERWPPSWTLS